MTAKELINLLQQHDPEKRVFVPGYEGGYDDVGSVETIQLKLGKHRCWYLGRHERDDNGECHALVIREG